MFYDSLVAGDGCRFGRTVRMWRSHFARWLDMRQADTDDGSVRCVVRGAHERMLILFSLHTIRIIDGRRKAAALEDGVHFSGLAHAHLYIYDNFAQL